MSYDPMTPILNEHAILCHKIENWFKRYHYVQCETTKGILSIFPSGLWLGDEKIMDRVTNVYVDDYQLVIYNVSYEIGCLTMRISVTDILAIKRDEKNAQCRFLLF